MSALGVSEAAENQKISCIPNNMDKYMTFRIGQLQFIDNLQFMNNSLDGLSGNLQTEDLVIIITTRMWANAQPDGCPAGHRWRPLFNAAKFG